MFNCLINTDNKAHAISTTLLELNFKNKLEDEVGKKQEKQKNLEEKNTKNGKKLDDTERNGKKREKTG